MEVILQKDFFAPNGEHFKSKGPNTSVEVPDEYKKVLPPSAKIVRKKHKEEVKPEDPQEYKHTFNVEAELINAAHAQAEEQIEKNTKIKASKVVRRG